MLSGTDEYYPVVCPFEGRFSLKYERSGDSKMCHEMSNCHGGHELEVKTFDCDWNDSPNEGHIKIQTYQCLGHWSAFDEGQKVYFAIMKTGTDYICVVSLAKQVWNVIRCNCDIIITSARIFSGFQTCWPFVVFSGLCGQLVGLWPYKA